MVIKTDSLFPFFALSLLGIEQCDASYRGVINEEDVYLPGIYVSEESMILRRVRQNRDILSHSVRKYADDPKVASWLREQGGMRCLDEKLVGRDEMRAYIRDLKHLRDDMGYTPSPVGEPVFVETDSATANSGYAVEAHRISKNRLAYGERDFGDEENTTPNWALTYFDFDLKCSKDSAPWWWKDRIFLGKFNPQIASKQQRMSKEFIGPANKVLPKMSLTQIETGGPMWRNDLRISDTLGSIPFTQVNALIPDYMVKDHPVVKEFLDRFYNSPRSLEWFKTGSKKWERWACGMVIGSGPMEGKYLWAPLSTKSSASLDWWKENDGKVREPKYCRALYYGDWIIAYRKVSETSIEVRGFKESGHGHGLMMLKCKCMHFYVWGRTKKRLIKDGAVDAYFGRPWEQYVEKERAKARPSQQSPADAWNSL